MFLRGIRTQDSRLTGHDVVVAQPQHVALLVLPKKDKNKFKTSIKTVKTSLKPG